MLKRLWRLVEFCVKVGSSVMGRIDEKLCRFLVRLFTLNFLTVELGTLILEYNYSTWDNLFCYRCCSPKDVKGSPVIK